MSGYLTGLVMMIGPTDRVQRSVLQAIADSADDKTGFCWPSIRTLANKTLFSTRYVIDAIQQLEKDHWMQVAHRGKDGRYTTYTVDVDRLETLRHMQRQQEKEQKRSGANVSPEKYLEDLLLLHAQVKPLHVTASPEGVPDEECSGEVASPDADESQVNPFASEVNSFAVSGEIGSSPNKKNLNEHSMKGETTPSSETFPEGLSEVQYAVGIFERVAIAGSFRLRELCATSIRLLAGPNMLNQPMHLAAQAMEQRIRVAQDRGETVNAFWFEDSKWHHDGGPGNGTHQGHRTGAAARTERAVGAWDRAFAERARGGAATSPVPPDAGVLPASRVRR